ncbi:MAG: IclR family transcriptional regulator [Armatimonadota bacterium]|nr:IclR family transcriptional regulator [Armatimonadota bacterium]MDR7559302.1 IclR family transcriptional regulator [Armatimonadota bacterium]MDR7573903.1 IclR family transcriptional regulator [Armatimonadota bacterium]
MLRGVERAATLLHRFTVDDPVLDLSGAARHLNVSRSTAYRVLRSLEAGGLLVYDRQQRSYHLSLAVARLGQVALAGIDLRAAARPYLRRLVEATGESAFLLVVEGRSAVVIDTLPSGAPLKLTYPVGTPWPLHAGASNKVLLAHLPPEEIDEILNGPLPRVTPRTTTDPRLLRMELQRIRRRGYAYSSGELSPGVVGIAVPIVCAGQLMGALAVAGPVSRLPVARVPEVVGRLKRAAEGIAQQLVGAGTPMRRGWGA